MYSSERYIHPLTLYSIYKALEIISGIYNGYIVYIDTDSRMVYNTNGQAVLQFRH